MSTRCVSNKRPGAVQYHAPVSQWAVYVDQRQKRGCSQAQRRASRSGPQPSFLHCMKSSQIFRPLSTRGHVIYQMNGPLFWTVEPLTVHHATRQVSPQYCFSLPRTVFSWRICIPPGVRAWVRHNNNNNNAWNSLWTHWMAVTDEETQLLLVLTGHDGEVSHMSSYPQYNPFISRLSYYLVICAGQEWLKLPH